MYRQQVSDAYASAGGPDGVIHPPGPWSYGDIVLIVLINAGWWYLLSEEQRAVVGPAITEVFCLAEMGLKLQNAPMVVGSCQGTEAARTYEGYVMLGSPGGLLVEPDNSVLYPVVISTIFTALAVAGLSELGEEHRLSIETAARDLTCLVALTGQPESL